MGSKIVSMKHDIFQIPNILKRFNFLKGKVPVVVVVVVEVEVEEEKE